VAFSRKRLSLPTLQLRRQSWVRVWPRDRLRLLQTKVVRSLVRISKRLVLLDAWLPLAPISSHLKAFRSHKVIELRRLQCAWLKLSQKTDRLTRTQKCWMQKMPTTPCNRMKLPLCQMKSKVSPIWLSRCQELGHLRPKTSDATSWRTDVANSCQATITTQLSLITYVAVLPMQRAWRSASANTWTTRPRNQQVWSQQSNSINRNRDKEWWWISTALTSASLCQQR